MLFDNMLLVAQLVEHVAVADGVVGSCPTEQPNTNHMDR